MEELELMKETLIERLLRDGIYNITNIEYLILDTNIYDIKGEDVEKIKTFIKKYPGYVVGSAYNTDMTIILSIKPPKFNGKWSGTGFNYGSTNILTDCPKDILILAEND